MKNLHSSFLLFVLILILTGSDLLCFASDDQGKREILQNFSRKNPPRVHGNINDPSGAASDQNKQSKSTSNLTPSNMLRSSGVSVKPKQQPYSETQSLGSTLEIQSQDAQAQTENLHQNLQTTTQTQSRRSKNSSGIEAKKQHAEETIIRNVGK